MPPSSPPTSNPAPQREARSHPAHEGDPGISPARRSLALFVAGLMVFQAGRLLVHLSHPETFSGLGPLRTLWAYVHGVRFDASIWLTCAGAPLLLLMIPHRRAGCRVWTAVWGRLLFLVLAGCSLILVGNAAYFGLVQRHVGQELFSFHADPRILLEQLARHAVWIALWIGALLLLWLPWRTLLGVPVRVDTRGRGWTTFLAALVLMIAGIRGGFGGKPLAPASAFLGTTLQGGLLTLNGPFVLAKTATKTSVGGSLSDARPEDEQVFQGEVSSVDDSLPDPRYPLHRHHQDEGPLSSDNVVVVLVESLSAIHVDAWREKEGLPPQGLTPNLDRLARQGWMFTRFYANGQRSIHGITSLLAGIPTPPGLNYLGDGLEQTRLLYIGSVLRGLGRHTSFLRGAYRHSYRLDRLCPMAGFDVYHGAEDMAGVGPKPDLPTPIGVYDVNLLRHTLQQAATFPQPFFSVIFTLTMHDRYLPDESIQVAHADPFLKRYLTTLRYTDQAVGDFVDEARRTPWGARTWFVITADHIAGVDARDARRAPDFHHIPLLILPPGPANPRVIDTVGSQVDLMPTMLDLLGASAPYGGMGRSLMGKVADRSAFCVRGDLVSLLTERGWVVHQGEQRVQGEGPDSEQEALSARLRALQRVVTGALVNNLATPPENDPANP